MQSFPENNTMSDFENESNIDKKVKTHIFCPDAGELVEVADPYILAGPEGGGAEPCSNHPIRQNPRPVGGAVPIWVFCPNAGKLVDLVEAAEPSLESALNPAAVDTTNTNDRLPPLTPPSPSSAFQIAYKTIMVCETVLDVPSVSVY